MAHDISTVMIGGRNIVEAMYSNRPAWHGLGQIFDPNGKTAPDSAEAMRLAHLDWTVEKEPFKLLHDGAEAVPGFFATVRQDTKTVLGIVGERYEVQQNAESFEFLDDLVMDGIMRYESAMALGGGTTVALLARMPQVDTIVENDHNLRYILFTTTHDGTGSITIMPTWVRVVCANTLRLALGNKVKCCIRHTSNKDDRLKQAAKWISQYDEGFTLFRDHAKVLATKKYTEKQARDFVAELFPEPKATETDRVKRNHREKLAEVNRAIVREAKLIPAVGGTWWGLVNGITNYVDHSLSYKGNNKNENRFYNVTDGKGAELKDAAFALALAA